MTLLREAHLHIDALGEELSCIDLSTCSSQRDCLDRLAFAVKETPHDRWLKAVGARVEAWQGDAWPSASDIAHAAGGRKTVIFSFDHHAIVASAGALQAAGITRETPDPPRGLIERDPSTGQPTGLLLEEACVPVYHAIPAPSDEQYLGFVRAALSALSRYGFVEAHDMLSTPRLAHALLELDRLGELDLSIRLHATRPHFDALAVAAPDWRTDRLRLAGLKVFTDGTLNSRTASMLTDYADPIPGRPRGTPLMSPEQIEEAVRHADSLGYPIAAHAIGDAAVRATLDAIERAGPSTLGQRIEHAQFIDEDDVPRFAGLGVIAGVQPSHLLTDIEAINRLMPHRAHRAFPLRDLIDAAASAGFDPPDLIYLGSDAPVVSPDPADTLHAAVTRRRPGMSETQSIAPNQAISPEQTLTLMRAP